MKKKIVFYPVFEDKTRLEEFLFRLSWYLFPLTDVLEEIVVLKRGFSIDGICSKSPYYLSDELPEVFSKFDKINVLDFDGQDFGICDNTHYVFLHDELKKGELLRLRTEKKLDFEVVRVDHEHVQYADSFFLRFGGKFPKIVDKYREIATQKVSKYLPQLKTKKCYLFGTGPNFSLVENYAFDDGLVVACNSMVVNEGLMNRLNPDVFVIADPIFHAGPSSYAGEFREKLVEILKDRHCPLFVPLRDYHIYKTYLPEDFLVSVIPIDFCPIKGDEPPLLDILRTPSVATTSNILTLFQIPIAATLADEIYISGCDGRPLSHNSYFWKHSKSVQINDQMEAIKIAHPSFFEISYDDYYDSHIKTLEKWLSQCELSGKKVVNLTPSYIPALSMRMAPDLLRDICISRLPVKVSVIIPLYNSEDFLEEAVNSILASDLDSIEILIIDDFSDDNGLEVAKRLEEANNEVSVFQNFHSKGVSGARNTGLDISNGKYLAFLDSDDTISDGSLDKRVAYLDAHLDVNVVHSTQKFVDENGRSLDLEVGVKRKINFNDMVGNPTSFNTLVFRDSVKKHIRFDEALSNGEDWLALGKVLRLGFESHFVPNAFSTYRIHSQSTVVKDMSGHEVKVKSVLDWLYSHVPRCESIELYRAGLPAKTKEDVINGRSLTRVITAVFKGDTKTLKLLMRDTNLFKWLDSTLTKESINPRLKVPFIRCFNVSIKDRESLNSTYLERTILAINFLKNKNKGKILIESIEDFLSLKAAYEFTVHEETLNVSMANQLYRDGKYDQALDVYQALINHDEFYSFLSFNVLRCEEHIKNC